MRGCMAMAVAAFGVMSPLRAGPADRMVAELERYRAVLQTVEVRCRMEPLEPAPAPPPGRIVGQQMHCIYAFAENAKVVDITNRLAGGSVLRERFAIEPGWVRPTYSQYRGDPAVLVEVTGHGQVSSTMQVWETPLWFLGLEMPDLPYGLDRLAATAPVEDRGSCTVDGHECVELAVAAVDEDIEVVIACDPASRDLPRRLTYNYGGVHSRTLTVASWLEATDPVSGERFLFPKEGVLERIAGSVRFVTERVDLNPVVDPDEFAIDVASLPDGVRVSLPGTRGTRFTGDRPDLYSKRMADELPPAGAGEPIDPAEAHGPAVTARRVRYGSVAFVVVGVILVGGALRYAVKARRS